MKKVFTNLTFWVLTAVLCGALLGNYYPDTAVKMKPLGDYFIRVVTWFIYPIIFLTITLGIAGMSDLKRVGKIGGKAIIYFEIVTTFALLVGIVVAHIIQPGKGVTPRTGDVSQYTAKPFSWSEFLKSNITLQIVIVSIVLGIVLSLYRNKEKILSVLSIISRYVFIALKYFMYLAPIGAFGGMAYTIGKFGIHTLIPLAKLMLSVYCTAAIFIFIVLWLILRYYKVSIYSYLNYIKEELLLVLGTSSSESALPALIIKLENMGCSKAVVGLVVPAGYSFNLDGTTLYLSMAVLFLSQVFNVELSFSQMLTIIGVLLVTSKGAAGVTGSGFVVLASTLTAVKVIPVEGLAMLLGVDRFMSEMRSLTNFIGNGVATIFLANNEKEFDRTKMHAAFAKRIDEYKFQPDSK